jgi:acyl-CoA reductase-like NAD-dependent aldehyde dehydrogenase
VVNIVSGFGPKAGAALCRHPLVDKIAFTGSGITGRKIQTMCTEANLKRCTLELGGKSANIVFPDIDPAQLDQVVESCHSAIFYNMGQVCCAGSRLFVHADIYDEFVKRSIERARRRTVGDPFDRAMEQGPQVRVDVAPGSAAALTLHRR